MTPLSLMVDTFERYSKMTPGARRHDYIRRMGITRSAFDSSRECQLIWRMCLRKNFFRSREEAQAFMDNIGEELNDPDNARTYKCHYGYPVEHYHFGHSEIPESNSPGVWTFESAR